MYGLPSQEIDGMEIACSKDLFCIVKEYIELGSNSQFFAVIPQFLTVTLIQAIHPDRGTNSLIDPESVLDSVT